MLPNNVKIKICGLMTAKDIEYVNQSKPDYAGFVFAPSRRRITPVHAQILIAALDSSIKPVGVFVDTPPEIVAEITHFTGLKAVQLHGNESNSNLLRLRLLLPTTALWKVHHISGYETSSDFMREFDADLHVVDTMMPQAPGISDPSKIRKTSGGSGKTFNWQAANYLDPAQHADRALPLPILLAGGLNPDNVQEALQKFRPFGVDVSSGVERHGKKDPRKIEDFIQKVRSAVFLPR